MPKVSLPDFSGVAPAAGFASYSGETPPKGVYRCKTGLFRLKDNSSGDPMFQIIFEINEPAGSKKAKYNGYAVWHQANITEVGAPYLNAMLVALGIDPKKAYAKGAIVTSKDKPEDVLKIAGVTVRGIEVLVTTKRSEWPVGSGEFDLKATSFAPLSDSDEDDDDDQDDDDDDDSSDSSGDDDDDDDDDDSDSF